MKGIENSRQGPSQPSLESYCPTTYYNETYARVFNPLWYKQYKWISFDVENEVELFYECDVFSTIDTPFKFYHWRKHERLKKHNASKAH